MTATLFQPVSLPHLRNPRPVTLWSRAPCLQGLVQAPPDPRALLLGILLSPRKPVPSQWGAAGRSLMRKLWQGPEVPGESGTWTDGRPAP